MKKKKTKRKKKEITQSLGFDRNWKNHLMAFLIFLVTCLAFFYPQLQGKKINQGDIVSWKASAKEILDYRAQNGKELLWTGSMFSGMPAYMISVRHRSNILSHIKTFLHLGFKVPIGLFLLMMFSFYLMLIFLDVNPWIAIIGGLAFGLSTYFMVLVEAGHNSKLATVAFFPIVVAGFIKTLKKEYLIGGILFGLGIGFNIMERHVQMSYYLFISLLILGVFYAIEVLKNGQWNHLLRSAAILLVAAFLGICANMSYLWSTYNYSQETMRGDPILEVKDDVNISTSSETEGLEWTYATKWSNNVIDLVATLIPRAAGGSSSELVGESTEFGRLMRQSGAPNVRGKFRAPMYWGGPDSVGGPSYFGAVIWLLFILGLFLVEKKYRWWIGISVVLLMIFSMGSNATWFNRIFFDYFPMFNKFRAPNSILTAVAFFVPFLGILTLDKIYKNRNIIDSYRKPFIYALGVLGGFVLITLFIGPSLLSFTNDLNDAPYRQNQILDVLIEDRRSIFRQDSFRSLVIISLVAVIFWSLLKKWISWKIFVILIACITVADLWFVGRRYLDETDFVSESQYDRQFTPRTADQQILNAEDNRGAYRVLDLSVNTFNSSIPSFFHNTIGGYSAAKLQRYQDVIERYISKQDQDVLNMLNTKYIISNNGQVQTNPRALGNAWFVDNFKIVNTPNEEIDALATIDPSSSAVVLGQEFSSYIDGLSLSKAGNITMQKYDPQHLEYSSSSPSPQFAVFSEIWSNKHRDWITLIDGEPTEHIRVNYLLRGLKIPAGDHKIEFIYSPKSYYLGSKISFVSSLFLILALIGVAIYSYRLEKENSLIPEKVPAKSTLKKRKSRKSPNG